MPTALAQKYETLTQAERNEVDDFVSFLISKREMPEFEKPNPRPRVFGSLEGKVSAKFSDDWEMTTEEFLGL